MAAEPLVQRLAQLPTDRVVALAAANADDIAMAVAAAGTVMPAVLTCRVWSATQPDRFVRSVLDDMEAVAVRLFPAWLPEADGIRTAGGAGLAAVRAVASARAAQSQHFGPFLSDLAELALTGHSRSLRRFPPETRAIGLARVIADGFGRRGMVLVVHVANALDVNGEQALAGGSEWLANRARIGVWLTGVPLNSVDWLASATVVSQPGPVVPGAPVVVGTPHPASAIEAALESALAKHDWAAGRRWNHSYQSHVLRNPVRLDLLWPDERCVVEIDGPEHRAPLRFEADRQRDVQLQLDGYAVLRFTNARIHHDVEAVVQQIGTFIRARRRDSLKGQQHD